MEKIKVNLKNLLKCVCVLWELGLIANCIEAAWPNMQSHGLLWE